MKSTMFFASYKDAFGKEHANLYFDWNSFHADTFSPECEVIQLIEFATHGRNYKERKNSLVEIAVKLSHNAVCGLSYGEIYHIQNFFESMGKRYGLLREFEPILKANGYHEIRSRGSHFIYGNGKNQITVNKDLNKMVQIRLIKENNLVEVK